MHEAFARVARLAERQLGVFPRAQALARGVTPDQIDGALRSGRWVRVHRGVYRIAGVSLTREASAMAAALATDGWVSHETAAVLFDLERVETNQVHVSVPGRGCKRVPGVIVHRPLVLLERADRTKIGPIPVTTPPRTIVDLATRLPVAGLEDALDSAIRKRLVDPRSLLLRIEPIAPNGRKGFGALRGMLEERCGRPSPGSGLESDLRRVLEPVGIPMPIAQYTIRTPTGEFVARPDFAYPDRKVAIEADGYQTHSSRRDWEYDRYRQNRMVAQGWTPVLITKRQIRHAPGHVVLTIAQAGGFDLARLPAAGAAQRTRKPRR